MTKQTKRAELNSNVQEFLNSGGRIMKCEPQEVKTKYRVHARESRNKPQGGNMPTGLKSQMGGYR